MPGKDFREGVTPAVCPACGYKINAAGSLEVPEPRRPLPGDFSVCMKCVALLRFVDGGGLVLHEGPIPADVRSDLLKTRAAILRMHRLTKFS